MSSASDAATTVAIDPTLLALLPVVGVLLTIIAGLIGATVQRRGERAKWLRERRLEAYSDFLVVTDEFFARGATSAVGEEPSPELVADARRVAGMLHLLGPDKVYGKAQAFRDAMMLSLQHGAVIDEFEDARISARRRYIEAARSGLK